MSSKRTTAETKQRFSREIQKKISGLIRVRILLDNARAEYYSLVDGTEYGPNKEGFDHFLQANYGVEIKHSEGELDMLYDYNVINEKKHTLFLLKFGTNR